MQSSPNQLNQTRNQARSKAAPAQDSSGSLTRKIGLKTRLLGAVLITITSTAAIVYFPWAWTSRRNVDSVVAQVTEDIAEGTAREVGHLFDNVESVHKIIEQMAQNLVDMTDLRQGEQFYLQLLIAHPNFSWLEFGFPDGDFFGGNRDQEGRLSIIQRDWNPETETTNKVTTYYQVTPLEGNQVLETENLQEKYYAPQRPWYQSAMANSGKLAWSDVYVFRTSKTPGINASRTLQKQGKLIGVASVAFELNSISSYLQTLQGDQPGAIFIVNSKADLIAFTSPDELGYTLVDADSVRLKRLDEASDPYLQFANQVIETKQIDLNQMTERLDFSRQDHTTGEVYYISLSSLGYLDWVVGTVIPESNYLTEINRNKRTLFFVISGFVIIATIAAIYLTDRTIAEPIVSITDAASAIESEQFEAIHLEKVSQRSDELGQLARVFQRMAQEVYAREQQLKQQLQDLKIEIDETKRKKQVSEIVETDFFKDLQAKARKMRASGRNKPIIPPTPEVT